jgi:predicted DNA-binding WGR domain protein
MLKPLKCKTPSAVPDAAHAGAVWKAHLEFIGTNLDNKSGQSEKFWEIVGKGLGMVTVRWGKVGSKGTTQKVTYAVALERLYKKYNDGYQFA